MRSFALALCLGAVNAASAPLPHALLFGSFRDPLLQRSSRARALAQGLPPAPDVTQLDYTGPIQGLGFVEHSHAAVARNTTLFLDDYSDILLRAGCAAAGAPQEAAAGGLPFLPEEAAALARRTALAFTAMLSAGPGASEAARLLAGALAAGVGHVVLGASALAAAPSCAALVGDFAPVYALRSSSLSGGALELALAPAALLEAFAGVRWSHRVTPDLDAALAERGETRAHYARQLAAEPPAHGPGPIRRALGEGVVALSPYVNANWDPEANRPVQESIALLTAAADFSGAAQVANASVGGMAAYAAGVFCDNCYAYFRHSIAARLEFCAYAAWSGSGLLSWVKVGISPAGVGCNSEDQRKYNAIQGRADAAYRLELSARYEASAGLGATLRAQLRATAALSATRMLYDAPRVGQATFYLASIPVTITLGASLALRVSTAGNFDAQLVAGVSMQARAALGFEYRQGVLTPVRSWEFSQEATPPRFSLLLGTSSLRFELAPALHIGLMGLVAFQAHTPLRLQADLRHAAPDAVRCDFPRCDIPGAGMGPLYVTWQPRLRLVLEETRLHHILGAVPYVGSALAKLPLVPSNLQLWPERELLNTALTARNALLSVCVPVDAVWTLSAGWAASGAARQLALRAPGEQQVAEPGRSAGRGLLTSGTCGQYGGAGGSGYWANGVSCTCAGSGLSYWCGCSCRDNWQLLCSAGHYSSFAGSWAWCEGARSGGVFGCSDMAYAWNDGGNFCTACRAGSYSSGGAATACADCPAGRYSSSSASSTCQPCPAGYYAPYQGLTTCMRCPPGTVCPAGTSTPGSPSRTPSNTPSFSPTPSVTPTQTASPTPTRTGTGTRSFTPTPTQTGTPTASPSTTRTLSATPSHTPTPSRTASPTSSPSATLSPGATASGTPTPTQSPSETGSPTPSPTPTPTPSGTVTGTGTASASTSDTHTPSGTGTATASQSSTPTGTRSQTSSATRTPSGTPTFTPLTTPLPSCDRRPLAGEVPLLGAPGLRATQAGAVEDPAPAPLPSSGLARVTRVSAAVHATLRLSGVPAPRGAAAGAALADALRVAAAAAAGLDAGDMAVTVASAGGPGAAGSSAALTATLAWRVSAALVANVSLAEAAAAAGSAPTNASRAEAAASRADAQDVLAMVEAAAAASASLLSAFAAGAPSGGYSPAALDCGGGSAEQQAMRLCAPWRAGNATAFSSSSSSSGAEANGTRPGLRALAGAASPAAAEPFAGVPGFLLVLDAQVTAAGGAPLDLAAANASVTAVQLSPASATERVVNASQVAEVLAERLPPWGAALLPPPHDASAQAAGSATGATVGGALGGAALLALAIGLALLARARAWAQRTLKLTGSAEVRTAAPIAMRSSVHAAFPAAGGGGGGSGGGGGGGGGSHGAPQFFSNPMSAGHHGMAALAPGHHVPATAAAAEAPEPPPMPMPVVAEAAAAGNEPASAAGKAEAEAEQGVSQPAISELLAAAPVDPLALARERRAAASAAGASAGGGAGGEAHAPRSYHKLAAAESRLSRAEAAARVGGLLHRVFRPREVAMTEVYAALLVQSAWRRAKAFRARAHFAKVAVFDRVHPAASARAGSGSQG